MTRMHRSLALLLAVLLLLLLLSACADRTPAVESPAPIQTEPPAAPAPTPKPTPEPSPEPSPSPTPLAETAAGLQITELMPCNRSFLPDPQGNFHDWIELCNTSDRAISLEGLCLSDSAGDLTRFPLPGKSLGPGEYLLVFCGSHDGASFSLKREGETVYLAGVDGSLLQALSYGETEPDASVCFRDGEAYTLAYATPGYPNDEQGYEDFLRASDRHGPLVISEIASYNARYLEPGTRKSRYDDWIELRNDSDQPLDLGDYALSDDPEEPFKSPLPDRTLAPGACVLVWCSGDSSLSGGGEIHAGFRLSIGESVYLRHESEGLSDCLRIPRLPGDGSYGRLPGQAGFFYLEKRSPGAANGSGYRLVSEAPSADLPQGIYEDAQGLQLRLTGPGEIRYTTDGSVPTDRNELCTGPISLEKTTVIRAVCFEEGKHPSACLTLSYIVNEGHSLPVVSLVCDRQAFLELNTYITQLDRELPADAVMFEGEGAEPVFRSGCSVMLHGASSRKYPQKTYKLIFRDRFGGSIRCDPFQRGEERDYHALLLRGRSVNHMYILKDALASLIAMEVTEEPLTLDARYCVLYINGSYYGIYALREAYCSQYGQTHTGSSAESLQIEKNRGAHVRVEIYEYLRDHSVKNDADYDAFCQRFDVDAFATWLAMEAYFNNQDPEGNIRYIRGDGTGGLWTAALFDLDLSLYNGDADFKRLFNDAGGVTLICSRLMENPRFRETLLRNAARLYHNGLGAECSRSVLTGLTGQLDSEMERNCLRWHEDIFLWEQGKQALYDRLGNARTLSWIRGLQAVTKASDEEIAYWFGDLSSLEGDS